MCWITNDGELPSPHFARRQIERDVFQTVALQPTADYPSQDSRRGTATRQLGAQPRRLDQGASAITPPILPPSFSTLLRRRP